MKQWYDLLYNMLESDDIPYERTTLILDDKILKMKDGDWSSRVVDGQLVKIIYKSTKLSVRARTKDDLKFELGTIELDSLESDDEFNLGIVGWLKDSENYHGKSSLDREQHIVLFKASSIPSQIITNKTLKIKVKPNDSDWGNGCANIILGLVIVMVLGFFFWLFSA